MSDSHRQRQPSAADVTPEGIFHQRRAVMKALGIAAASLSLPHSAQADVLDWLTGGGKKKPTAPPPTPLTFTPEHNAPTSLTLTPEDKVTGYNNFYEFGLDKADPAANAGGLRTEGWKVQIEGEIAKPITLDIDDIIKRFRWKSASIVFAASRPGQW